MSVVLQNLVTWMFHCKLKSELLLIWIPDMHFQRWRHASSKCTSRIFQCEELANQNFYFKNSDLQVFLLKFTTRIFTRKCKKSELRHRKQTTIHFNYKSIVVLLCICYKYAQLGFLDELQILEVLYRSLQVGFSVKKSELWVYCSNMRPIPFFTQNITFVLYWNLHL